MDTLIGIGVSTKLDSFAAGKEAAKNAAHQLESHHANILIVFISPIFDQEEAIQGIRSIIPETPLIGCSTAGTITAFGALRNSIGVCAIKSDTMSFSCGAGNDASKNPRLAGNEAAKQSSKLKEVARQLYIMFCDGLSGNATDILRGAQEIFGTSFPIIGGTSSDDFQFQKTYQYFNDTIYTDSVVGLLVSGNAKLGIGKSHGWQPIGKPHIITKARSNIIKEIDKKRAVELYEDYLGKSYNELTTEGIAKLGFSYPLGIQPREKTEYLIRVPLKTEDGGGLTLSAEIPERTDINLMIGDRGMALEAAKNACLEASRGIKPSKIKFVFIFSDIARFQLLRKGPQTEVEIIKDIFGKNIPFFGCYTCGEYAPLDVQEHKGQFYFHNQVISVTTISE